MYNLKNKLPFVNKHVKELNGFFVLNE